MNHNRLPLWKYALPPAAVPMVAALQRDCKARDCVLRGARRGGAGPGRALLPSSLPPGGRGTCVLGNADSEACWPLTCWAGRCLAGNTPSVHGPFPGLRGKCWNRWYFPPPITTSLSEGMLFLFVSEDVSYCTALVSRGCGIDGLGLSTACATHLCLKPTLVTIK